MGRGKKQVSRGLWGNWRALVNEDCRSRKVCECVLFIDFFCSVTENGGKGVYFSATDKHPPQLPYQSSAKTQITALIMIPLTMRPLPPTNWTLFALIAPAVLFFQSYAHTGLSVDSVSAVFKNDWFSGSPASLPLIGATLWGGLIMNQTAVETVSAPVWTWTL